MNSLERSRQISRAFTRPVLERIAQSGQAGEVVDALTSLGVNCASRASVGDLFDASLSTMQASYRCEYVYKAAIANRIVFGRHSPRTSSLAVELGVGRSIVDAAVFNGTSTAYEVKTEFDSPRRLSTQTPAYLRAFDRVYVVTHQDLAERYASLVDSRVGILCLTNQGSLHTFREAASDITRVEPDIVFRMLRRREYMDAAHKHFGPQAAMPNGLVTQHYQQLFSQLDCRQAHDALVSAMRARTTDMETVEFVSRLPASLRALAYATPLSRPRRHGLLAALAVAI